MKKNNLILAVLLLCFNIQLFAQDKCEPVGWATQNGGVTGGGNATPVVVSNYNDFKDAVTDEDVKVVHVSGTITFPSNGRISFQDQSDKTIFGLPGSKLVSVDQTSSGSGIFNAKRLDNIIFQNLVFEGPGAYDVDGNDNMTIDDSRNIWVDHCEFRDGTDGNLDIKNKSDFISVTWCIFRYLKAPVPDGPGGSDDHRYSNLFGSSDGATGDRGKLRITMQYCWWGEGVRERMPRVRYGKVHMVNNLFNSDVDNYGIRLGFEADVRAEGNYFDDQRRPIDEFDNDYTAIYASNNVGQSDMSKGSGFTPPYSIDIADPNSIVTPIMNCAGATLSGWGACAVCSGTVEVKDCNGDVNGTAYYDDCDICVGGNTGKTACTVDCNGDVNGSASLDACGVCTGGNTGVQACSGALQAEDFCAGEGVEENTNEGFQGDAYYNFDNVNGASVTYYVVSSGNQSATLGFRFANGGTSARGLNISVNGSNQGSINGSQSGGWTTWISESATVNLADGVNTIVLSATSDDGGPNLDLISLPARVTAGGCTADCNGVVGGSAFYDNCNECVGGTTGKDACTQDCNGDWGGTAYLDNCDECVEGNTNATACTQDCAGDWGGTAEYDNCGVCGGTNECTDCNGDINGDAYLDDCGVCVAGNTGKDACTGVMQAEDYCELEGIFEDKNEGFFGTGYVNTDNLEGASVSWVLSSSTTQSVDISFRYANGGTTPRDGEVFVNGVSNGALSLPVTGAWTTWNEGTVSLSLASGLNEIEVVATSGDGLANIDALFLADGVEDANCAPIIVNVSDVSDIALSISPNPTSNVLNISKAVNWTLESTFGQVLKSGNGSQVIVSDLENGTYLLKVEDTTFKFIKD